MSTLINRNVTLNGRRTSLRLEPDMWEALQEVCEREDCDFSQLFSMIEEKRRDSSLTAAIRAFLLIYFRNAATERGHSQAGHGSLMDEAM